MTTFYAVPVGANVCHLSVRSALRVLTAVVAVVLQGNHGMGTRVPGHREKEIQVLHLHEQQREGALPAAALAAAHPLVNAHNSRRACSRVQLAAGI